jgi:hypothetical protein
MVDAFRETQLRLWLEWINNTAISQETKEEIYASRNQYGAPYLYLKLQNYNYAKVALYLKYIQDLVSVEKLNEFMLLNSPTVGGQIHGLLIAMKSQPEIVDHLIKLLSREKALKLFQQVFLSQLPFISQQARLSDYSLRLLDYEHSDDFWADMAQAAVTLEAKLQDIFLQHLVEYQGQMTKGIGF